MADETATAADVIEEIKTFWVTLSSYPEDTHYFCPKHEKLEPEKDEDYDYARYDDPDVDDDEELGGTTSKVKKARIESWELRQKCAYRMSLVYGLNEEEASEISDIVKIYETKKEKLLTTCDMCVRRYHQGRKSFRLELSEFYDESIVDGLMGLVEENDTARIDKGLKQCVQRLAPLQPKERTMRALSAEEVTALFEALCSKGYHQRKPDLLQTVLTLMRTAKPLRLAVIVPAMGWFLFDQDPVYRDIAAACFERLPQPITKEIFDWVLQDALSRNIAYISAPGRSSAELERFWWALELLLNRLDKVLITHSVCGLDVSPNIYHLALQHLSVGSETTVKHILDSFVRLLDVAPEAFWSAYGAISPSTIAEQVFTSQAFPRLLAHHKISADSPQPAELVSALTWVTYFMGSIPADLRYQACECMLNSLFKRYGFQKGLPLESKMACIQTALTSIETTLSSFAAEDYQVNPSTTFIAVGNVLKMVDTHKEVIIIMATLPVGADGHKELAGPALRVLERTLLVNSKTLKAEYQALRQGQKVQLVEDVNCTALWQAIADAIQPGRLSLARAILAGLRPLIGLEKFLPPLKAKAGEALSWKKQRYNKAIDLQGDIKAKVLQRISDFRVDDQLNLFNDGRCSQPLFAGLLTAHEDTYAAAVELLKTVTEGDSRKEAVRGIVDKSMCQSLVALKHAAWQLASHDTLQALPFAVKTGGDVLSALCDTQSGLLRTRAALTGREKTALQSWWSAQWDVIDAAYAMTADWNKFLELRYLKDFARDAMEYAENMIDGYKIISSMISKASEDRTEDSMPIETARKVVLDRVGSSMASLVRWLRLSDTYLVSIVVRLVCKILRSLGEVEIRLDPTASKIVDSILVKTTTSKLVPAQRQDLREAMEENWGKEDIEDDDMPVIVKVQSRLDGWSKSANGVVHEPSHSGSSTPGAQEVIDLDKWRSKAINDDVRSLSGSLEHGKPALDQMRARQQRLEEAKTAKGRTLAEVAKTQAAGEKAKAIETLKEKREREKEEKRQRDAIEIAKARALRTPIVRGEGSGLAALAGVIGKDHAPVKNEMMVTSDEESSEDDDDDDPMALIRKVKGARVLSEHEKQRRAAARLPQGPVKKTKIIRSHAELKARITPDMTALYKTILNWDIFYDGESPPGAPECVDLPAKFRSYQDYQDSMYPLLVSEAWMSLSTELETVKQSNGVQGRLFSVTLINRMSVDSFYEISTTMTPAENKDVQIGDADIVILSEALDPLNSPNAPHCLARVHSVTRRKNIVEVTYRVRSEAVSGTNGLTITPNRVIKGFKLASMTSIEREYSALKSLQHYDLCAEILDAEPSKLLKYNDNVLQPIMATYGLNKGQAAAVKSAKDNDAFTLIQGPPGTGKTKTIVAMIGALLTGLNKPVVNSIAIGRPVGPAARAQPLPVSKKLLVCAPSNAAVDELVSRLMDGIVELTGEKRKIKPLRLGRSDKINASIREVTLDGQLEKRLQASRAAGNDAMSEKNKLHERAAEVKAKLAELRPQLDEARTAGDRAKEGQLQREFDVLKREQSRIGAKFDEDRDQGNTVAREMEIQRRKIQQEILNESDVLCATLSGSGHDMFKNLSIEFETVIIDEAAQSIEISSLIPLKYGCTKCIMVGDPKQLPPTVLSTMSAQYGYEKSMFVRMQSAFPDRVHMLDTQYRMHPEISKFPSKSFYDSQLHDGPGLAKLRMKPWHQKELFGPYRFFDVRGTATRAGKSMVNRHEIEVAIQLYSRLKANFPKYDFKNKIGIITPYKGQLNQLRRDLIAKFGPDILDEVDTNTTDAYQGREAEIIIFSCVRAEADRGIGFLNDIRRMNVGLTRAKSSMWVLGDSNALKNGKFWKLLLDDAFARGLYTEGNILQILQKPLAQTKNFQPSDSKEIEMPDFDAPSKHKGPVRRPSKDVVMRDAPSMKEEARPSNITAPITAPKSDPLKSETTRSVSGKRSRERSPDDSGPPRKVPALPSGIPGLRIPGQPKPTRVPPIAPKLEAPLPPVATAKPATLPPKPVSIPTRPGIPPNGPKKAMPRRKPADPFLSTKPRPKPS